MTIKENGGIFGRNPTFNNVTVDGALTVDQIVELTGAAGITLDGVKLKDGNVVLTDGKGIDFSATSGTGTSELFDDYEEGAFSPTVSDGTNSGSFSARGGRYTKAGRIVQIELYFLQINTTGLTAGAALRIGGLPFAHVTSIYTRACLNVQAVTIASTSGAVSAKLDSGQSTMTLINGTSTSINTDLLVSAVTSGSTNIYISGVYEVA
jgi:hypothetical protein